MFPEDHIGAFVAEMDFGTAPAVQIALRDAISKQAYGYMPARFAEEVSQSCASWQRDINDWDIPASQIFPIVDVISAMELSIEHSSRPDRAVIVPTPAYPPFRSVPPGLDREVIEGPMISDAEGRPSLDLDGISKAFKEGAGTLILCNPQSPTGRAHTRFELAELAEVVDRHGGRVFSDEIHSPLIYAPNKHVPYASVSDVAASHTFTATATSKAWNTPGLKCAQVIISNDSDLKTWKEKCSVAPYTASSLGAVAATAAYNDGRDWLFGAIEYLDGNRHLLGAFLAEEMPQVRYSPPEATYLAWLDFRGTPLAESPTEVLREKAKVVLSDGSTFGEPGRGWSRLNFAMPRPLLEAALTRISLALNS